MTNTPSSGRNRRAERYQGKPQDVTPVRQQPRKPKTKAPIGRSAELQARMRSDDPWQSQSSQTRRTRTYSDFVEPDSYAKRKVSQSPVRKKKRTNNVLWLMVSLVCLVLSGALAIFSLPQLTGMRFNSMQNIAFVNGSLISRDQERIDDLAAARLRLPGDRIAQGVQIDGVHVGGMTVNEAIEAVYATPGNAGSEFSIDVRVNGNTWNFSSNNIPLERNVEETVLRAWAIGRGNTIDAEDAGSTPFSQRLKTVDELAVNPQDLWTSTTYNREMVRQKAQEIADAVNRAPVNAAVADFNPNTKTFTFHADEPGLYLDAEAIYADVTSLLDSGAYFGTLMREPQVILADVTKAELMNRFGLISSFTTKKTGNSNRTTNIALSAQAISNRTILPGETFSFNRATGERTPEKGYKQAAAIAGGATFDDYGGGVCQTSSTLFNAVARANLTIVSRKPHAWPSDYVPMGEDATVNYPNLDFKFRNDTQWPVYLVAWCDKSAKTVTVEVYGMSLGDGITIDLESEVTYTREPPSETKYIYDPTMPYGTEEQTVKARTGYTVVTWRVCYDNGEEVSREELHTSNYPMYQKTVKHNKPNVHGMETQ